MHRPPPTRSRTRPPGRDAIRATRAVSRSSGFSRPSAIVAGAALLAFAATGAGAAETLVDAASEADRAAALAFLDGGADASAPAPDGTTPLHWAAYHDDVALAQRLLAAGASPNALNDYGSAPLFEAATNGSAAMIELLLDAGADAELANADGQTALMIVARTNAVDAARALLEHGADPNRAEQWRGQTPLMWAAAQGQPEMIRVLIEHGADPDVRARPNEWARQVSAESRRMYRPAGGFTPLMYAAREGCTACARALVEGGADPDMANPKNVTPLYMAIDNMHFDTAKYLIEAGASVDKWDWWGRSPVFGAADMTTIPAGGRADRLSTDETSALEILELLLARGANPNLQLKLPPPYRSIVDDRGCDSMLTTGMTPLLRAAKVFDVPAMQLLLEHGADPGIPNEDGVLPIMAAAGLGSSSCDPRGYGPGIPHYETADVEEASIAALATLLDAGVDVNAQAPEVTATGSRFGGARTGQTALHGAATWGWNDVVAFLVERGARVDVRDANGRTPYDMALGRGGRRGRGDTGAGAATAELLETLCAAQAGCDVAAMRAEPAQ